MKKFYDEVNFYKSMNLFNSWAAIAIKYLVYHTEKKTFVRGQKVYQRNDSAEFFYIVKSGEFQIKCKIPLEEGENENSKKNSKNHFVKKPKINNLEVIL